MQDVEFAAREVVVEREGTQRGTVRVVMTRAAEARVVLGGAAVATATATATATAATPLPGSTATTTATAKQMPHVVLFHGAGLTAKSFQAMVSALPRGLCVTAFDMRGHGGTTLEPETDLAIGTLVEDAADVLRALGMRGDVVFVGHSLGGSVATRLAVRMQESPSPMRLCGLVVIDAVEGVALGAIDAGRRVFADRPRFFDSPEAAVKWSLTHGPLRGYLSASVSVPDQLRKVVDPQTGKPAWTWRTDVLASSVYWEEWFAGLSNAFLSVRCPKLLVLAGIENLDTALTAAHMQGKFQLFVMSSVQAGHFVHEDAPGQTSSLLVEFLMRHVGVGAAAAVAGSGSVSASAGSRGGMTAEQVLARAKELRAASAFRP